MAIKRDNSPAVGIDLGTTFSVIAHIDDTGHPITLANAEGDRTVYFAGQLGIDKSGTMAVSVREQIELAFANLKAALASVGAGFEHVVKINNYIVDIGTNIAPFREIRDKYVSTAAPPASTTIGVPELARPGALFEIEAIAILPTK